MVDPQQARVAPRSVGHYIELGGQAVHVFHFPTHAELAYQYFCDIPAVFQLLPDAIDVRAYGPERYRLTVGASDGHGHSMAAVFDMLALHEPGQSIRILPDNEGPAVRLPGTVFRGALAAEAVFYPEGNGTAIEYSVDIALDIPIPRVLRLMPHNLLQNLGERAMEFKMTQMIGGFARSINADFTAWLRGE